MRVRRRGVHRCGALARRGHVALRRAEVLLLLGERGILLLVLLLVHRILLLLVLLCPASSGPRAQSDRRGRAARVVRAWRGGLLGHACGGPRRREPHRIVALRPGPPHLLSQCPPTSDRTAKLVASRLRSRRSHRPSSAGDGRRARRRALRCSADRRGGGRLLTVESTFSATAGSGCPSGVPRPPAGGRATGPLRPRSGGPAVAPLVWGAYPV